MERSVTICTPTYNRRNHIRNLIKNVADQDYPKKLMQWIIADDGEDKIEDLIQTAQEAMTEMEIVYIKLPDKVSLGKKRNMIHKYASNSILVYMDDDDYYPPTRVSHAVDKLIENPHVLCAGCSKIYVYFTDKNEVYFFGPYHSYHATANTFAFRRELLEQTKYEDHAKIAEEKYFLKNYTIPMVQLNTLKTVLVVSHSSNTYDKKQILKCAKKSKNSMNHFIASGFSQNLRVW